MVRMHYRRGQFMSSPSTLSFSMLLFMVFGLTAAELDSTASWTRFRGPNGTGVSSCTNLPSACTEQDCKWKSPLPGLGHSSPVVWQDKLFVLCAEQETAKRLVVCLQIADGRQAWQREYPPTPFPKNRDNSYASSTLAADRQRIYANWASTNENTVLALDHSGTEVWRRNLGPYKSQHGPASSPVVFEDLVVVNNDQDGPSSLVALDAKTGQTRWQVPRRADRAAYSTPCVYQSGAGSAELVFSSSSHGLTGVAARSGKVIWELTNAFPFRVVGSPILADGLVVATCGEGGIGRRLVAVRPGSDLQPPQLVYEMKNNIPYVPTPLAKDGLLFLWSDNGLVSCHRAATGERIWQQKISDSFYSSPVWAEGRLYGVSKAGTVYVLSAGEKYELISKAPLGEPSFASPAIAGGRIFFRTETHLFAFGK